MRLETPFLFQGIRGRAIGIVIHQRDLAVHNHRPVLGEENHRIHPFPVCRLLRFVFPSFFQPGNLQGFFQNHFPPAPTGAGIILEGMGKTMGLVSELGAHRVDLLNLPPQIALHARLGRVNFVRPFPKILNPGQQRTKLVPHLQPVVLHQLAGSLRNQLLGHCPHLDLQPGGELFLLLLQLAQGPLGRLTFRHSSRQILPGCLTLCFRL